VIVVFDSEPIRSMGEIQEKLRKRTAGSLLEVTVARGQRQRVMSLILGEVPG
jgi:hypothetical protein